MPELFIAECLQHTRYTVGRLWWTLSGGHSWCYFGLLTACTVNTFSDNPTVAAEPATPSSHTTEPPVYAVRDGATRTPGIAPPCPPVIPPTAPLLDRLGQHQRASFLHTWDLLTFHLRENMFDLLGAGWTPSLITDLDELLCAFPGVFSS